VPRWLRVIRGMIGMGLTFSVGVGVIASAVAVIPWLLSGPGSFTEFAVMVVRSSIWAFPIGVVFSGVLAVTARGGRFEKLSLPRFALLGAAAGLIPYSLLALNAWSAWDTSQAIGNATIFMFLGGGSATAALLLARRAGSSLPPVDEPSSLPEG